jgi:hypothetical protein
MNASTETEHGQEAAQAMETIIRATAQTNKPEYVCDVLVACAKSLSAGQRQIKER